MLIYKAFRWVQHIQNLTFSDEDSIDKSCFFCYLILAIFFCDFGTTWCQKTWFWEPLGAQLGPKMASKIAQVDSESIQKVSAKLNLGPTCFQGCFGSAPGHHFGRFWEPLGTNSMDFSMIFDTYSWDFRYPFVFDFGSLLGAIWLLFWWFWHTCL